MKKTLLVLGALISAVAVFVCGCSGTSKTTDLANSETSAIVADAISAALIPAVEITLEKHQEYADLVAEVATEAAKEWPQGKTVTLTVIGDQVETILAQRTDLSATSRTAIIGLLSSLRAGVRVYLTVRGYELPEVVTTDGAALMQQIAAIALATGASSSNG
ncbi:hypothetical protein [uncultured Desulfuromonas sp.]|uniref:hypothetical protein n=1 Tax=uncultured Desulfuromonas sp. TaxID=181013 RepID=UPI002AAC3B61|nr:hypothetical protein [uncultured Desulfuromonas sp.]